MKQSTGHGGLLAGIIGLTLLIFVADVLVETGMAGAVPYVGVIVLALWLPGNRSVYIVAAAVTALAVIGVFLSPEGGELWKVLANRAVAIFAIWLTALLCVLRKRGDQQVLESATRLRTILENAAEGIITIDETGQIESMNNAAEEMFGYTEAEILGHNVATLMPEPFHSDHASYLKHFKETGEKRIIGKRREVKGLRKNGSTFPMEISVSEASLGNRVIYTGIVQDISARKKIEDALGETVGHLRTVITHLPLVLFATDRDGIFTLSEGRALELVGLKPGEAVGKSVFELYKHNPEIVAMLRRVLDGESINLTGGEGDIFFEGHYSPLLDTEGEVTGITGVAMDTTARTLALRALEESEARYSSVFKASSDGFLVFSGEGQILDANPAACRMHGYTFDEIIRLHGHDIVHASYHAVFERIGRLDLDDIPLAESLHLRKDGSTFDVEVKFSRKKTGDDEIKLYAVIRDVSLRNRAEQERRRLEAQVLQAQKLESLGVMAGGIAHDFNNLLVGILGNADQALQEVPEENRKMIEPIVTASQRAADLCRQLLAYSGKGNFVMSVIDITEIVAEMLQLMEVSASKKAQIEFNCRRNLPCIEGDATQLRQVIMNLITNASEALEDGEGTIRITTGTQHCDRKFFENAYMAEGQNTGTYVYLEVQDTGTGMDEETLNNIFDPLFTTKFTGRGLGLSAVLGIVRSHRGAIHVNTAPGEGTTFKVLFPPSERKAEEASSPVEIDLDWHYDGLALVVDDESSVRDFTEKMLNKWGLKVLTGRDGREGVEVFKNHEKELDVVILDMTMPHLSGEEAFEQMRTINTHVPIILMSGYNESDALDRFSGEGLSGFLQKPYRSRDLLHCLHASLGNGGNNGS